MRKINVFIISLFTWILLSWPVLDTGRDIEWQSLIAGVVFSLLTALIFGESFSESYHKFYGIKRYFWILIYIPVFFWEMIKANIDVMYRVIHPDMPINPGIVKVKTSLKSKTGITALCNSITLTPGTLTVDVTDDGHLYIHWINVKSMDINKATKIIVQRFENILKRIFD